MTCLAYLLSFLIVVVQDSAGMYGCQAAKGVDEETLHIVKDFIAAHQRRRLESALVLLSWVV